MSIFAIKCAKLCVAWMMLALLLTAAAAPASAQKKKDKKQIQQDQAAAAADADLKAMAVVPETQQIEQVVGEALGYWQIGDVDSLHKYYSDDVVMVSGEWEPPVIGWNNFLKSYEAQREAVTGGRIDRSNTYIKVNGDSAWATYQFVFTAMADSKVIQFHGHTTLVLNKVAGRWLIVLNHSSIVDTPQPAAASPANSAESGRP